MEEKRNNVLLLCPENLAGVSKAYFIKAFANKAGGDAEHTEIGVY
jgi:hypothetical protein